MPEDAATPGKSRIAGLLDTEAPLPDEEVVARVLDGDRACFELLMRRYNQRLFRAVRGLAPDDDEAEDVAQEAWVRAYERLHQFEGRSRFSTWLMRIAINEAMARRRRRRRVLVEGQGQHVEPEAPAGEDRASMRELRDVLTSAVDALPEELRCVFMLRAVEGLDTQETAECLGLSEANVKVRLHRARAMLQARVDARLGAEIRRLHQFDGDRCDRLVAAVFERLG